MAELVLNTARRACYLSVLSIFAELQSLLAHFEELHEILFTIAMTTWQVPRGHSIGVPLTVAYWALHYIAAALTTFSDLYTMNLLLYMKAILA